MIGRLQEKKVLLETLESDESEFVAVYGRRRVGKTYLIHETLSAYFTFVHTGIHDATLADQLMSFRTSLLNAGLDDCPQKIGSWLEAFELLMQVVEQSEQERKVIFLDELPWMDTPKSKFLSAFENFWNSKCSMRKDIVLVICGSATSWIIDNVLSSHGGLYNRVTLPLYVRPFNLKECEEMVREKGVAMSRGELVQMFMMLGGIPFYIKQLRKEMSLAQNIDRMCFAKGGALTLEFSKLYASLFRNPNPYIAIITALSEKRYGLTRDEISKATGIPLTGRLSKMLEELAQCDFIRQYNMLGNNVKGAVFQLIDNFTTFYFSFMKDCASPTAGYWSMMQGSRQFATWAGLAFERVCLWHVPQIKRALGVSGVISTESAWRFVSDDSGLRGTQIDLIINRNDNVMNLCEMKHCIGQFVIDKDYELLLREMLVTFQRETGSTKSLHLTMVTTYGVKRNLHSSVVQSEVTMDDLFADGE